jgi:hypothetical protein
MKMKMNYQQLGIISVCIFLVCMLLSTYVLYNLPVEIHTQVKSLDKLQTQQMSTITGKLSMVVGGGLVSALIAIMVLILGSKNEVATQIANSKTQDKHESYSAESATDQAASRESLALQVQKIELLLAEGAGKDKEVQLVLEKALRIFCTELEACQGALFLTDESEGKHYIIFCAGYAYYMPESQRLRYEFGEGLAGQVAKEGQMVNLASVPDHYITILSGLGKSSPNHLLIAPIKHLESQEVCGVMEIASFKAFTRVEEELVEKISFAFAKLLGNRTTIQEGV